jgi:phenylacetate-CoA ligase
MFKALKERIHFALFCTLHRRSLSAQKKWQLTRLRGIVRHAKQNVPLWKPLLMNVGDDDLSTLEDISKLPITRKETYLGKMAEEYTDSSSPAPSYWYVTSGTSGKPFTFLMGAHARQTKYTDFASMRFLWWRGVPLSRIANINFARIKIHARSSKHRYFLSVQEYLKDPRTAIERIKEFKPEILGTYPSLLLDIARMMEKEPELRIPSIKFAMSFGETISPAIREEAQAKIGCEVYDRYGLEEIGAIGVECEKHDGFHINTESVFVEVLDDEGKARPHGEEGRVVVTDLFNYAMPFIRYDSGDSGSISYEPCACGLRSPRVWVKGRYSAYLTFSGRRIHHLEFDAAMDTFMNQIFQYQIVKKTDSQVLVRIVRGPSFRPEVLENIRTNIGKLIGKNVRIDVDFTDAIAPTPRGKCQIVKDESGIH